MLLGRLSKYHYLFALILAFLILAGVYSFITPLYESPDEVGHFSFITHLLTSRSLPVQRVGALGEAHQPPLYYLIAALAAMPAEGGGKASGADSETKDALKAAEFGGAWDSGDTMAFDEIIDPRELRNAMLSALELSAGRETGNVKPRPGGIRP